MKIKDISLLEETYYYPFGLIQQGISSKAASFGNPENKLGYGGKEMQGKEFSDGSGLELLDFHARSQDPQLGRFWQIDPKCELFYHVTSYNYCFNNPMLFVDPDGMQAQYNWDDGKYYDNEQEVGWNEVQQQYGIGEYASSSSVMLAPQIQEGREPTQVVNDGNGGLSTIIRAAMKTGGNIRILHVENAKDAAEQIEKLTFKILNLLIASHGVAGDGYEAYFAIGWQTFQGHQIAGNEYLARIAKKLESTLGPLPSAAGVILLGCGSGGTHNKGVELTKALAKKLNATVYASQSFNLGTGSFFSGGAVNFTQANWPSLTYSPTGGFSSAYQNTGKWTRTYVYGSGTMSQTVTNVYFDAFGKIHYTQ